ncbi:MAG: hypothetical protein KA251_03705 [Saprospiraceae bacterium]|nr:hypothetical protein [Candidatus Vicinibacter affinis]MBP6173418.1 hypothetical protein [Saprospiraceae bacterium]MBK7798790.1 hypothetical protein [Candidatus Vicinibacter affinis]MBK8404456.1 hypothetical protein [Candidatus Vicinibacter affinis]MBK8644834.1 hypothetical protein [Candidatus Vicinibacter affinis]
MLKTATSLCLICQSPLHGRRDKRFCNDGCRAIYHQQNKPELPLVIKKITQILKLNREILLELNPEGKRTISKELLLRKGFDLKYMTHQFRTKTGNHYYFCFDQGYVLLDDQKVLLVRQDE